MIKIIARVGCHVKFGQSKVRSLYIASFHSLQVTEMQLTLRVRLCFLLMSANMDYTGTPKIQGFLQKMKKDSSSISLLSYLYLGIGSLNSYIIRLLKDL